MGYIMFQNSLEPIMPNQLVQDRPRDRTPFLRAALFAILAACGGALMASGMHHEVFARFGVSEDTADTILGIVTGVLLAASLVSLLKAKYGRDSGAPENRIDEFQTQQRRIQIAITVLIMGFGAMAIFHPLHHDGTVDRDFSIEFALLAVAAAATATFGVGFLRRGCRTAANDELVRALRARAVQIGYMLAMIGLSAVYMLWVFRPDLMTVALPAALLVGIVAPTGYFLIAERRANSDG
jgi:hypothetical protein